MSRPWTLFVLLVLASPTLLAAPHAEKLQPDDEKLLKAAKISTEAPALLDYFHKRTITAQEQEKVAVLIRQLGDDSFKVREQASETLLRLGNSALPQLHQALNDADEEIRERAREGSAAIESKSNPALTDAVVRALRVRAPAETVKTLLDYLPDAENETVADEVLHTLAVLGVKENKVDAGLIEALKDKHPARRAAAALVVGRSGTVEQRRNVHAFLKDADPRIRFRAAQGLLAAHEAAALPALMTLLTDAPQAMASRAEELLSCVSGGSGPRFTICADAQQNRTARNGWEQWLKQNAKLDLRRADVDLPPFNPTLRARDTARLFMAALLANEKEKLEKLAEFPFTVLAEKEYSNRDQFGNYLSNLIESFTNRGIALNPNVLGATSPEAYQKSAPPNEQPQLMKLRKKDIRIVFVSWQPNIGRGGGMPGDLALFVRVTGDQAQVTAIGSGSGNSNAADSGVNNTLWIR